MIEHVFGGLTGSQAKKSVFISQIRVLYDYSLLKNHIYQTLVDFIDIGNIIEETDANAV